MKIAYFCLISGFLLLGAVSASAQMDCVLSPKDKLMTLALKKDFVNANKDRATIKVSLHVDHHLKDPHPIKSSGDDGDIHMAGRSDDVRLPLVAEIMNAAGSSK